MHLCHTHALMTLSGSSLSLIIKHHLGTVCLGWAVFTPSTSVSLGQGHLPSRKGLGLVLGLEQHTESKTL